MVESRPHHVQMLYDNYDIIHNPHVKELYPALYKEVIAHDRCCTSSWYDLTDEEYAEYCHYLDNDEIGYYS